MGETLGVPAEAPRQGHRGRSAGSRRSWLDREDAEGLTLLPGALPLRAAREVVDPCNAIDFELRQEPRSVVPPPAVLVGRPRCSSTSPSRSGSAATWTALSRCSTA